MNTVLLRFRDVTLRYGAFVFRFRDKMFPVALIALIWAYPPAYPDGNAVLDFWVDIAAVLLALAGQALRSLTVGLDYIKRGGLNKQVYADRLVSGGMFAHCRNPLYLGNIMIATGLLMIPDRIEVLFIGVTVAVLTYVAIVAKEEAYLRVKFGAAYDEYCRKVNRWLPDPRGLGRTLRGMRFNWRRMLLKEWNSFFGWVAIALIIDGAEQWAEATGFMTPDFLIFVVLFALVGPAYLAIRVLKRMRRLNLDA